MKKTAYQENILYCTKPRQLLELILNKDKVESRLVAILCDRNTRKHCLLDLPEELVRKAVIIEIPEGESSKSPEMCSYVWSEMARHKLDKSCLMLNLGGGMITDLGGFLASTYKRGISYINIPTSLLGMIDAAIGGKTALNIGGIKNLAGIFASPEAVIVCPDFLKTLPEKEFLSGFGEFCKQAILGSSGLWNKVSKQQPNPRSKTISMDLLKEIIEVKKAIVKRDPFETGERKSLNFGHSFGHALESLMLPDQEVYVPHGQAVALGMIAELFLSVQLLKFNNKKASEIEDFLLKHFRVSSVNKLQFDTFFEFLRNDKKNRMGKYQFSLLKSPGKAVWDIEVNEKQIKLAWDYLMDKL